MKVTLNETERPRNSKVKKKLKNSMSEWKPKKVNMFGKYKKQLKEKEMQCII